MPEVFREVSPLWLSQNSSISKHCTALPMQTSGTLPFVQPPLVQYSAAQSLTISAALNLDFCLLNSQNYHSVSQPGSAWALPLHHSLEHVPDRKPRVNVGADLLCFSSFRDHSPVLSEV